LESRKNVTGNEDDVLENTPFRVIFTYNSATTVTCLKWKEANIRWIVDKSQSIPLSSGTSNVHATTAKTVRQVRFVQPQNHQQHATISASPIIEKIPDLCQAIAQLQQPHGNTCAGYLLDSLQRKHGIFPLGSSACYNDQQSWSAYSLRQILTSRAGIDQGMMGPNKYKLAVDLASSVLQLHRTPWLCEDWNSNDVYFVQRPGTLASSICEHTFIDSRFSAAKATQKLAQPPMQRVIRNPTLFALGILLIELLYEKPIEDLQTDRDRDCEGTPGAIWCTAVRLVDGDVRLKAGLLYSDAVRRCIYSDFNQKTSSLDDQDFQRAVFDGVVVPLETSLKFFEGDFDEAVSDSFIE
jgi:hypothetical protein